jgi:hypothetical protein
MGAKKKGKARAAKSLERVEEFARDSQMPTAPVSLADSRAALEAAGAWPEATPKQSGFRLARAASLPAEWEGVVPRLLLSEEELGWYEFDPLTEGVVREVNGATSVEQLGEKSGLSDAEIRAMLITLAEDGVVGFR